MPSLPYRQVHLDFHTSGEIPEVGAAFDPAEFRRGLENAAIDSITCFSVCHHGYSYHPTRVGVMHPGLKFDLLRAQMDAAHEAGAAVPVYLSAGATTSPHSPTRSGVKSIRPASAAGELRTSGRPASASSASTLPISTISAVSPTRRSNVFQMLTDSFSTSSSSVSAFARNASRTCGRPDSTRSRRRTAWNSRSGC